MTTNFDVDDTPELSEQTLAALKEFYQEQKIRTEKLKNVATLTDVNTSFDENWQLSQFWYDEHTVNVLTEVVKKSICSNEKIALISCPTLYKKIKNDCSNCEVTLFEYDERFSVFGNDFIFYDYKSPLDIPQHLLGYYDIVIADPPFLSEECLSKTATTIKFLAKKKIILCTGTVMADLSQLLLNLHKVNFEPRHKNNLANDFSCLANFDFDSLISDM